MKNALTCWSILIVLVNVITQFAPEQAFAARRSSKKVSTEEEESQGPGNRLGAGIMLGDLNGVSVKYLQNNQNSFDGGFSYRTGEYATLHGDYLWNVSELFGLSTEREVKSGGILSPYFGIGAIMFFDTSKSVTTDADQLFQRLNSSGIALGARVPVGVEYLPSIVPCGIFGEIAPGTVLIPGMIGFVQAEAGVRFYM